MRMYSPIPLSDDAGVVPLRDASTVRTIGIVDDNLDPALVEGVAEALEQALPGVTVRTWVKPSGSAPAPEEMIDEVAASVDVAVAAIAMCGSCTAGVVLDATRLHKRGVPTHAIAWGIFEKAARSMARLQGVPELPLVITDKVNVGDLPDDQRRKGRECGAEIAAALRDRAAAPAAV